MRRPFFSSFINFVNTYSIWVALGSFSSYLLFTKLYQIQDGPDYLIAIGLALGVWFIYTLDHLLDGVLLKDKALALRHKKHYQNQKSIIVCLVIVGLISLILAFWLPLHFYPFIGLLTLLTGAHFIINYLASAKIKKTFFLKEVFIALVVTLGLSASPLVGEVKSITAYSSLPFLLFFWLNLANLILFSMFDRDIDQKTSTLSLAGFYATQSLRVFIASCLAISFLLSTYALYTGVLSWTSFCLFCSMQLTLVVISVYSAYFTIHDRYRFYGDLIYLYPLLALPYL